MPTTTIDQAELQRLRDALEDAQIEIRNLGNAGAATTGTAIELAYGPRAAPAIGPLHQAELLVVEKARHWRRHRSSSGEAEAAENLEAALRQLELHRLDLDPRKNPRTGKPETYIILNSQGKTS